jgi:hypothetical protein
MKAMYDKDGVAPLQEVELIAYDWDKYVTFKTKDGEVLTEKLWKFNVKRSNKLYHLPRGYDEDVQKLSRKAVSKLLKEGRKAKTKYSVKLESGEIRRFKSLNKALNFCKSFHGALDLHGSHNAKRWSCSTGIITKEDGFWYYFTRQVFVSEATLSRFCKDN